MSNKQGNEWSTGTRGEYRQQGVKTIAIEKAAAAMVRAAENATAEESKAILLAQHEW